MLFAGGLIRSLGCSLGTHLEVIAVLAVGTYSPFERVCQTGSIAHRKETSAVTARGIKLLLASLLMLCVSSVQVFGQEAPSPAPSRLGAIVYHGDLASLLAHLTGTFDVTIGFEADPRELKPEVSIQLKDATLADVLNAIVQAKPEYQWRSEGGAVDLYPKVASCTLLETGVHSFRFNGSDWTEASYALTDLPEVRNRISDMGLNRRYVAVMSRDQVTNPFSVDVGGVTVRRALHEIARKSGNKFWVFRRYGENNLSFSITNSSR
jgi:hypothetical protein